MTQERLKEIYAEASKVFPMTGDERTDDLRLARQTGYVVRAEEDEFKVHELLEDLDQINNYGHISPEVVSILKNAVIKYKSKL